MMRHKQRVNAWWIACVTALVALGWTSVAHADDEPIAVAKIPFAFVVGNTRLPAGDYVVKETTIPSGVLAISSADGRRTVYTLTIGYSPAVNEPARGQLAFEKYGNQYFLSKVEAPDGVGRQIVLTPTIMEREIEAIDAAGPN